MGGNLTCIIPMYNASETILKLLESIEMCKGLIFQEILIIDDGSTDDSVEIIEKYKVSSKLKIKLIKQSNQKQSAARNNGLRNVETEYVCFLDADDVIYQGFFELVKKATTVPDSTFFVGAIERIYGDSNSEKKLLIPNLGYKWYEDLSKQLLICGNEADVGLWNKIFSMDIITKNDLFFENSNFFEDSLFILKYVKHVENVKVINTPVYGLNKTNESTTRKFDKQIVELANMYLRKIVQITNKSFNNNEKQAADFRIKLHVFHHFIKYGNKKEVDEYGKKLKKEIEFNLIKEKLPKEYKIALLIILCSPKIYRRIFLIGKQK